MNCLIVSEQGIQACGGGGIAIRMIRHCPTCKQRRRFTGRDEAWYGVTVTCCTCGDTWSSGERLERPFRRGWRKEASAKARKAWATAVRFGSPEYEDFIRAEIGFEQSADAVSSVAGQDGGEV
jgi:hypothetical protein